MVINNRNTTFINLKDGSFDSNTYIVYKKVILKKLDVEPFHTHPMTYITLPSRKTTDVVIYKTSSSSVNCGAGARVARADRTVGGRGANEKLRRSDFRFTFPGRPLINPSPPSLVAVCPIYRNSTARSPSPNWSGPATSRPRLSAAPSPRLPPPGYLSYASGVSFFFFARYFRSLFRPQK